MAFSKVFIYSDIALDNTNLDSIKTATVAFAALSLKMANSVAVNELVVDFMAVMLSSALVITYSSIKVFKPFVAIELAYDYSYS